jgi:hypothetical protein
MALQTDDVRLPLKKVVDDNAFPIFVGLVENRQKGILDR